jgi:hypothetical protein
MANYEYFVSITQLSTGPQTNATSGAVRNKVISYTDILVDMSNGVPQTSDALETHAHHVSWQIW